MSSNDIQYGPLKAAWLTVYTFMHAHRSNIFGWISGIIFGFLMSKAGATTFDFHAKMFLLQDFQLMIVIGTAVVTAMVGVFLLKFFKITAVATGEPVDFVKKPYQQGLITGAFLFGIGWAMTASCPGTIPAMIGEGKVGAIFTFIGLVLGTMAFGVLQSYIANSKSAQH